MKGFLLDTNCISEIVSPVPDVRVIEWIESIGESMLYLSVLTLAEIQKGAEGLAPGKRRTLLTNWLEVDLQTRFAGRILPVTWAVADRWGSLAATAKRNGIGLPVIDGLLAATALVHDLTIVSRNTKDFRVANIPVLNLWLP